MRKVLLFCAEWIMQGIGIGIGLSIALPLAEVVKFYLGG
jgi:hypothetical protein